MVHCRAFAKVITTKSNRIKLKKLDVSENGCVGIPALQAHPTLVLTLTLTLTDSVRRVQCLCHFPPLHNPLPYLQVACKEKAVELTAEFTVASI